MTPQQIVGMAAKLFAIWLVVTAFQVFAAGLALKNQIGEAAWSLPYLMPALPLVIGVLLWLFPMTIADKLVPRVRDTNTVRAPAREVTAIASVIIGIWVLIGTLPLLVTTLGLVFVSDQNLMSAVYFTPERKLTLLGVVLQWGFALLLVFKPWSIANKVFPAASDSGAAA
jgi:hypothetical protein